MAKSSSTFTSKILLIGSCLCLFSAGIGQSQHSSSMFSWQHESFLHETASLSMSNAAVTHLINPAVAGRNNQLQLRSNLGTTHPYYVNTDTYGYNPRLTNFALSYTNPRFWVATTVETYRVNWHDNGPDRLQSFRLQTGYQLGRALSIGIGTRVNRSSLLEIIDHTNDGGRPDQENYSHSFDVGVYYTESFNSTRLIIRPETGLSLNNIGSYHTLEREFWPGEFYSPLAGHLSWSVGLQVANKDKWNGRSWLGIGVYTGFNKYFARIQETDDGRGSGFRDLFTNWSSFETGTSPNQTIRVADQISVGLGAKITVLEILTVQYGRLSGADLWVRSRQSWGVGIEFGYFIFNMTGIYYSSEAYWDHNSRLLFNEIVVNVPISIFNL